MGVALFPVVLPRTAALAGGLVDLRAHPIAGVVHFVLLGVVAPALCLIAAAPTVLRLRSAGTRFSVVSAGIGACGVSVVQLGFGAVLICTRPGVYGDQAIAAAFHDLDGVKAALVAVALVGIMSERWSSTMRTRYRGVLVAATVVALTLYAVGTISDMGWLSVIAWVAVPLTLVTVCDLAGDRPSSVG
ncbi:hypothetical protein LX13_001364 [Williamsia maris]|uniref:DUF998 domain-containing protein n=1 Tax=Williamsia maris TaxID=72806 RepID=A0ABT1HEX6_9NOCA|nr:hypothetical protein [Williamsia maris]